MIRKQKKKNPKRMKTVYLIKLSRYQFYMKFRVPYARKKLESKKLYEQLTELMLPPVIMVFTCNRGSLIKYVRDN